MNILVCSGRLTKDPETRQAGKTTVTTVTVAWSKKIGNRENKNFYKVEFWGEYGKKLEEFFFKGNKIEFTGEPLQEEYIDKKTGGKVITQKVAGINWGFVEKNIKPEQAEPVDDGLPNDDIPF